MQNPPTSRPPSCCPAIRCARLALDRGIGGALLSPSSYFMKSPPQQYTDCEARAKTEAFILGEEPR